MRAMILERPGQALQLKQVAIGLSMGLAFGVVVALTGCATPPASSGGEGASDAAYLLAAINESRTQGGQSGPRSSRTLRRRVRSS